MRGVYISRIVNEGIRGILNLFIIFFYKKISHTQEVQNLKQGNKNKNRQRFYALKKHLRGGKSLIHLFVFLCFLCAFCAFCAFLCVKQKRQYFYVHKKHLRGRKSLVKRFVLFVLFVLFILFMRIKNM